MKIFQTIKTFVFCAFLTPSVSFGQTYILRQNVLNVNPAGTAASVIYQAATPNVGINVGTTPTNTLDVGGTARVRTLGASAAGHRYLRADVNGVLTAQNALGLNTYIGTDANGNFVPAPAPATNFWSLIGNAGTNPTTNFVGTTDNQRLVFRTLNTEKMTILPNGNVGIGVITPLQPLHTNGGVRHNALTGTGNGLVMANNLGDLARIGNGTAGQVLTQTAPGVMSWTTATGDNLGNHTATTNLDMSCFAIKNAKYITFCNNALLMDLPVGNSLLSELSTRHPLGIGMTMPLPVLGGYNMLAVKGSAYVEGALGSIGIYGNVGGSKPVPSLFCTPQNQQAFTPNQIGVRGTSRSSSGFHVGTSGEAYESYKGIGVLGYSEADHEAIGVYGVGSRAKYGYGVYGHIGQNNVIASYAIYGDAGSSCGDYIPSPNWAGYFNGDVFIAGSYGPSDRRLKTNINTMTDALSKIKQLHLTTYKYDTDKYKQMMLPTGLRFGVIADELEKVFPNMVKQTIHPAKYDSKGAVVTESVEFKAVNYTELIPVALQGIKEQQTIIEAQQATIADLKDRLNRMETILNKLTGTSNTLPVSNETIKLNQNAPNPFGDKTIITYELPNNMSKAQIIITDLMGKQIKTIQLNNCCGEIEISAQDLPNGTFIYSLIANGKILKSNKMIVAKQ